MGEKRRITQKSIVTFGGWYQRTTLHLSEIFDFLAYGTSRLELSKPELNRLHRSLRIEDVTREAGPIEYVHVRAAKGIDIRYYEDGLYILELETVDVLKGQKILKDYFDNLFSPAMSYIFSLGAPTPKIVANIPTTHPVVVAVTVADPEAYHVNTKAFGSVYQKIASEDVVVFKTDSHIFVVTTEQSKEAVRALVETQIFFREFKDQLSKYLMIHRKIWEDIADVKEKKEVKLKEAQEIRSQLASYQVTVDLIGNRINQMGTYVHTRSSLASQFGLEEQLRTLFHYRFEVLVNTHAYIKELWTMTREYLAGAISVVTDVQNQGTKASIQSLTAITTFGVLATVVKFSWEGKNLLTVTPQSLVILSGVLLLAVCVDRGVRLMVANRRFKLKFAERAQKI